MLYKLTKGKSCDKAHPFSKACTFFRGKNVILALKICNSLLPKALLQEDVASAMRNLYLLSLISATK